MAKYYILLGKVLYITWAFIIYYLGKYYYNEFCKDTTALTSFFNIIRAGL